jgi:hypothetical protein
MVWAIVLWDKTDSSTEAAIIITTEPESLMLFMLIYLMLFLRFDKVMKEDNVCQIKDHEISVSGELWPFQSL